MIVQSAKISITTEKEVEINGEAKKFKFEFLMPAGSPFGISYDAAHEVLREIVKLANEAADRAAREEVKEEKEAVES